jgi:hypothetical protein
MAFLFWGFTDFSLRYSLHRAENTELASGLYALQACPEGLP